MPLKSYYAVIGYPIGGVGHTKAHNKSFYIKIFTFTRLKKFFLWKLTRPAKKIQTPRW